MINFLGQIYAIYAYAHANLALAHSKNDIRELSFSMCIRMELRNYGITLLDGNLEQYGNESNVADLLVHIVSTALWVQVRVQLNTKAAGNWMFIPPIDKNRTQYVACRT